MGIIFIDFFDIKFQNKKLYNNERIQEEIKKRNLKKNDYLIRKDLFEKYSDGSCVQRIYFR